MSPELASICEQYGVTVVHPAQHRPVVPMHTAAGSTLDKILLHEGEDHLRDVLAVLTESENNKNMLIAPVIKAMSRIMAENPTWYASDATKFLGVMDQADLPSLYLRARANKKSSRRTTRLRRCCLISFGKCFRRKSRRG